MNTGRVNTFDVFRPPSAGFGDSINVGNILSGCVTGGGTGAAVGGVYGAAIGCAVGGAAGYFAGSGGPSPYVQQGQASSGPVAKTQIVMPPPPPPDPAVPAWVWVAGGGVALLAIVGVALARR